MKSLSQHRQGGFTLLEIMLVLVLMAIIISSVSFSFDIESPKEKLSKEARRFQAVFHLASDYALLNNIQLGLNIEPTEYTFLGYDGRRWMTFPEAEFLGTYELPEEMRLELEIGDIPWLDDQSLLSDGGLFSSPEDEEEEDAAGQPNAEKVIPQVYLFSSGEITPFNLIFTHAEAFDEEGPVFYIVKGVDAIPVSVLEPGDEEE